MSERHYGLSVPTQRRLFAVHLARTTDRPVRSRNGWCIAGLFACAAVWAVAVAGLFL